MPFLQRAPLARRLVLHRRRLRYVIAWTVSGTKQRDHYMLSGPIKVDDLPLLEFLIMASGRRGCIVTLDLHGVTELDAASWRFFAFGLGRQARLSGLAGSPLSSG